MRILNTAAAIVFAVTSLVGCKAESSGNTLDASAFTVLIKNSVKQRGPEKLTYQVRGGGWVRLEETLEALECDVEVSKDGKQPVVGYAKFKSVSRFTDTYADKKSADIAPLKNGAESMAESWKATYYPEGGKWKFHHFASDPTPVEEITADGFRAYEESPSKKLMAQFVF